MKALTRRFQVLFISLFLMSSLNSVNAANYYWVGGTGNWSDYGSHWVTTSGGVIFNTTTPGPLDDVYFDVNSFSGVNDTVYLDSTLVYCRDMDWTGATNNPVLKKKISNSEIRIYGSMTLIAAMKFSTSNIYFESDSTGNTITSGGQHLNYIEFNGLGDWTLTDAFHSGNIWLNNGGLNTNSQPVNCQYFKSGSTSVIHVHLGTSVIYCSDWDLDGNATVSGDSSIITASIGFDGYTGQSYNDVTSDYVSTGVPLNHVTITADGKLIMGNTTIQTVVFNSNGEHSGYQGIIHKAQFIGDAALSGTTTFDTLIFDSGSEVSLGGIQTINDLLSANGSCSGLTSIEGPGTINKTTGSVVLDYMLIKDISAGGGATFTANNSISVGNVTGFTVNSPAPKNLYWVGGTGNWNDVSHWALASGSTGGSCIPGPFDNVYFDAGSFAGTNDTVYLDDDISYCRDMDWTGATNNPVLKKKISNSEIRIYGSMTLIAAMKFSTSNIYFESDSIGNTITSGGQHLNYIEFNGLGDWTLTDAFHSGNIWLNNGGLNTNSQPVNCQYFKSGSTSVIHVHLGTSVIYCSDWDLDGNATVSGDSSIITASIGFDGYTGQSYNDVTSDYVSTGVPLNHVTITADGKLIMGNTTIQTVVFNSNGEHSGYQGIIHKAQFIGDAALSGTTTFDTLIFDSGSEVSLGGIQTINDLLSANGSCSGLTSIEGPGTINKTTGSVVLDYMLIKDISAGGGATFTANNSISVGNVTGFTVNSPAPKNLYWVGGTGNWNDVSHWALASGSTGGSCIPGPFDNVYFDAGSFAGTNDTVYLDDDISYCRDMDWTGATNNPVLKKKISNSEIRIYGSMTLIAAMKFSTSNIYFESDSTGNTITSGGQHLNYIEFNGLGDWTLTDAFHSGNIWLNNGGLNTNSQPVNCQYFKSGSTSVIHVHLGTSVIYCSDWDLDGNATVSGDSSIITASIGFDGYTGQSYNDVTSDYVSTGVPLNHVTITADGKLIMGNTTIQTVVFNSNGEHSGYQGIIHKAQFIGDAALSGTTTFDTLIFYSAGGQISLGGIQTIGNSFWTDAIPGFPIEINGPGEFSSPAGNTICLDYIYFQDITASGGAFFYAGDHSVDLGNNTGWTWSSCTPDTSNVWPGDANYDLIADNIDILYIGLAYGYTGPVRAGASTNWVAQPSIDWLQQFATGFNIKHADCDGNGTINAVDTNAVILNYGQVHPFKQSGQPTVTNFGTPLYFDFPPGALIPGSTVDIPIMFGTSNEPADKFYGVAFTVNYDPSLIQPGTMEITFGSTWFGNGANTIHINKDFYNNGMIDMAFVKTDHADQAGFGTFATLHFTLANNASGPLNLSFSKILVLDKFEIPQPVNVINGSVYTGVSDISSSSGISVYPNPAQDVLQIDVPNQAIREIKLINTSGQTVLYIGHTGPARLNVSGMANGVYLLEIKTDEGILRRKIIVSH